MMRLMNRLFLLVCVLGASAVGAAAQSAPAAPPPGQLVVERIESSWLVAPDARVADLDGRTGSLAGGYAGRITDRTWLIGGGGYWLTNRDDDFRLAYGGAIVEWLARADRRVGFGVRTLLGAGSATLPTTLTVGDSRSRSGGRDVRFGTRVPTGERTVAVRDEFFIAEPQLHLLLHLAGRYRFSVGVGYRLIGDAPLLDDRLEGLSGSIAFQIGGK